MNLNGMPCGNASLRLKTKIDSRTDSMTMRGLFVTGTDTDVGKTYVTSLIVRELQKDGIAVGVYKPVCTGADIRPNGEPTWRDVNALCRAIGGTDRHDRICPQRFRAPVAPPVAAGLEDRQVDSVLLRTGAAWWQDHVDMLVVEGVGGLLCPLTDDETVADLARDLGFPLVIVVRLGLGAINHTLLTVEVAQHRRLPLAGIVLNEVQPTKEPTSELAEGTEIARRCPVPILAVVKHNQPTRLLRSDEETRINWMALAANLNSRESRVES
jgi:dethiobiotin synthetase